jgi:aryl-phospho-beta-D-glucosidase BglC (GH1 family)
MVGYLRSLGVAQPITHTSIFDNNFATAKAIINALPNRNGYIAGVNMYFFSNPVQQHGDCLTGAVGQWARDPATQGVPLYIGEWGCSGAVANNTTSINAHLAAIQRLKASQPRLVGASMFSYQNERWKLGGGGEDRYGIIDDNGNRKPEFAIVQSYAGKI